MRGVKQVPCTWIGPVPIIVPGLVTPGLVLTILLFKLRHE